MANINKQQRLQEAVNDVVNYFHSWNKRNYATAIQNAVGYVTLYESGNYGFRQYRHNINKHLCESLYFMNCDPSCPIQMKRTVRQILENYRKMNGLPTDDFTTDTGEDALGVDIDNSASLEDTLGVNVANEGICKFILDTTEEGEEYEIKDIVENLIMEYPSKGEYKEKRGFENIVDKKIQELISLGYFEVIERDPINGRKKVIYRVG